jgi:hypothetical protein
VDLDLSVACALTAHSSPVAPNPSWCQQQRLGRCGQTGVTHNALDGILRLPSRLRHPRVTSSMEFPGYLWPAGSEASACLVSVSDEVRAAALGIRLQHLLEP